MHNKFLEYSYNYRQLFIEEIRKLKEEFIDYIYLKRVDQFNIKLLDTYTCFLNQMYLDVSPNTPFTKLISDFITSIDLGTNFLDYDEEITNSYLIEYNMIINIHKFSYTLFSLSNSVDDSLFYTECDILKFDKSLYEKSPYDTDFIDYMDIYNTKYYKETKYADIYLISSLSNCYDKYERKEVFENNYYFNNKSLISKQMYGYMLISEDTLRYKPNIAKFATYPVYIILAIILILVIIFCIRFN